MVLGQRTRHIAFVEKTVHYNIVKKSAVSRLHNDRKETKERKQSVSSIKIGDMEGLPRACLTR